jgi:hypothetical protein
MFSSEFISVSLDAIENSLLTSRSSKFYAPALWILLGEGILA